MGESFKKIQNTKNREKKRENILVKRIRIKKITFSVIERKGQKSIKTKRSNTLLTPEVKKLLPRN